MEKRKEITHVFWTGGLDSTFRVIYLLYKNEVLVQPHYIIRHEESTGNEIDAMNEIRRALSRKYSEMSKNLLPTVFINEDLVPLLEEVDIAVDELRKKMRGVHEQYQILARYCKAYNIEKIELTYEKDIDSSLHPDRLSNYFGNTYPFESFINPHEEITKKDYYKYAKEKGWSEVLDLTSFCRRPKKKNIPCGTCGPCHDAVENGIGFRLPLVSYLKAIVLIPIREYYRKNYHKHESSKLFSWIKKNYESKY